MITLVFKDVNILRILLVTIQLAWIVHNIYLSTLFNDLSLKNYKKIYFYLYDENLQNINDFFRKI